MSAITVEELRRAWSALESGTFRRDFVPPVVAEAWEPTERVVSVVGVGGRVGATTVALAIAEAMDVPTRVVEVGTPHLSGLAGASTAELGEDGGGWSHGTRNTVHVERAAIPLLHPASSPAPAPTACDVTVLDVGWELPQVQSAANWLNRAVESFELVLVAPPTVPGMRALELALRQFTPAESIWVAAIGPALKRWPKRVQLAAPAELSQIADERRVLCVAPDRTLAAEGITSAPLPLAVVASCQPIANRIASRKGDSHVAVH